MEGYTVISAKKVSLCDIEDAQEQKEETLLQKVAQIYSSPTPFQVVEVPSSPEPGEVIEIPGSPVSDVEVLSGDYNDNNYNKDTETISGENNNGPEIVGFLINEINEENEDTEQIACEENNSSEALGFLINEINKENEDNEDISCEDNNSTEVLGYLMNNNSIAPNEPEVILTCDTNVHLSFDNDESNAIQQNFSSNNDFSASTFQIEQNNSMLVDTLGRSSELYIDQNGQIQNEIVENGSEYFTIDFIASPNESNAEEYADVIVGSETDDASEIFEGEPDKANQRPFGRRSIKNSIDQYIYYICPQCGMDCDTLDTWKLHTEQEHNFGLLETVNMQSIVNKHGVLCHKCRDCPKTFELKVTFSVLIFHRISHLPYKHYIVCRICERKYKTKPSIKRHLLRDHKELNLNSKCRLSDSALEHIRFFCPVCKEEQGSDPKWKAHMKEQHDYYNKARLKFGHVGSNVYKCNECEMKVRLNNLVTHAQTHEEYKPFSCTFCNISVSQLKAALSHVRIKHLRAPKPISWKCSLCKATFKSYRQRSKHYVKAHNAVYQTCKICKKEFENSSTLLSHMNLTNHHSLKSRT